MNKEYKNKERIERIKTYQELCNLTNKEICTLSSWGKSQQYYGALLSGKTPISETTEYEILNAISEARAIKQGHIREMKEARLKREVNNDEKY